MKGQGQHRQRKTGGFLLFLTKVDGVRKNLAPMKQGLNYGLVNL